MLIEPPVFEYCVTARYGKQTVLHEVTGHLTSGKVVSLVGLSGSGKTTLSLCLLRLAQHRGGMVEGSIRLRGRELMNLTDKEMRLIRGKEVGYVPQSPASALNPQVRVSLLLEETWRAHQKGKPPSGFFEKLLSSVSLQSDPAFLRKFAGGLSVGQGQRLLIGLAIMHNPSILIADEPTSALDVITQSQILALLSDLARGRNMATLFISHDLQAVSSFSQEVQILHEGRIVESGTPGEIFSYPKHEFTQALVRALPRSWPVHA